MKKLFFILSTLLLINPSFAGTIYSDSTNRVFFPKKHGEKKWKFLVGLDARRSYFNYQKIKINGLRLGTQFDGVHRFGLGFYALNEPLRFNNIIVNKDDAVLPSKTIVDVTFTTLFYERVFYKVKKWEIAFPLYIGTGQLKTQYLNNLGNYKQLSKTPFSVIGISFRVKYYLLSWLAIRNSLGYRFTYNTNKTFSKAFRKPFYAFGLSISIEELIKSIKNKTTFKINFHKD